VGGRRPRREEFSELAEVVDGQPLIGTGTLGSRVWSGPAITVIGIDVPSVDGALNAVSPYARAKLNVRVHPEQDPREAQEAVVEHLRAQRCRSASSSSSRRRRPARVRRRAVGPAFAGGERGVVARVGIAHDGTAGAGGSIPLVASLHEAAPDAASCSGGTTDGYSNIHGPNERVLLDELERTTVAMADFLAAGSIEGEHSR
jgi:cysteinylglycine-S-conjugate dipeptidase